MFYVTNKKSNPTLEAYKSTKQKVYDIQYKKGYPFFLLYQYGQWITRSAKHYESVKE